METRYSEDVEEPQEKSESGSWEVDEPAKVRSELVSEEEKMPHADQIEDKEPRRYIPIQRNSIFNHTVRRKSKDKARDAREPKAGLVADSLENVKSLKEPRTLNLPQSGMSLWRKPTRTNQGAQRTSESSSTPGNGATPEECPALADSPTTLTEALQRIHPIPADSWRNLIEQIGLLYQEYRDKSTLQEIETRRQQDAEIQANAPGSPASEETDGEEEEEEDEEELASPPERKALPQICLLSNPHSRFNLWQDLPEIRSSGVLDMLQPEEIKLQEVRGAWGGRRFAGVGRGPAPAGSWGE